MNKHWLFFYNDIAGTLEIMEYGTVDEIRQKISEFVKGRPYIRQWTTGGMTSIDFGSHYRFLRIYPAVDVI